MSVQLTHLTKTCCMHLLHLGQSIVLVLTACGEMIGHVALDEKDALRLLMSQHTGLVGIARANSNGGYKQSAVVGIPLTVLMPL